MIALADSSAQTLSLFGTSDRTMISASGKWRLYVKRKPTVVRLDFEFHDDKGRDEAELQVNNFRLLLGVEYS